MPKNVHAFAWIPQLKVLAAADISINHGGIHTINECVHFGVPMLVYSGKKSDQNGCAARVHFHEIGIMADKDVDDAATIQSKIHKLLSVHIYKKNITEMQLISKKYKLEKRLIEVVDSLLKK
jgi:UDP:flavonoid glycosyltransferase YjiC (YdhE family)